MPADEDQRRAGEPAPTDDLQAGEIVGEKLRLERHIARGGMGTVWEASHLVLRSRVAIKFLDRVATERPQEVAEKLDRFRFEAQVSALLSSRTKHMVAVHDAGTHRGMPYLVMEYAPGRSLQDLLDVSGRAPVDLLVSVAHQVGEALDAAHDAGIVHRDVKPGNILLVERAGSSAEGESTVVVKLTDFGVAKPTLGRDVGLIAPKQTGEGLIVGSPAYMSPEQISANADIDGASDRWSLGVVLFEGLTGWLPFRGESMTQFALSITVRPHDPPTSIVEGLAPGLDAFFARALAKERTSRFATCGEMSRGFDEAVRGKLPGPQASPGVEAARPAPGRRGLVLGVAVLLAAVAGVGLWSVTRSPEAAPAAASSAQPAAEAPSSGAPPTPSAPVEPAALPAPSAPSATAEPPPSGATPPVRSPPRRPAPTASAQAPTGRPPPPRPPKNVDPSETH